MISIKPKIDFSSKCVYCNTTLKNKDIVWQGIHVLLDCECPNCKNKFLVDLPIGHAQLYPFVVDKNSWELHGSKLALKWFGAPLLKSLKNPSNDKISMTIEKIYNTKKVAILNCIDFLYGHSLLKLLNAESLLDKKNRLGLVVIIPKFLRWMVPKGVAEIWTVDLPLKKAKEYYPQLERSIKHELERFEKIYLPKDSSHPRNFKIESFTGIKPHNYGSKNYRITFIWREDRPWFFSDYLVYILKKINFIYPLVLLQNLKIRILFLLLKRKLPNVIFSVAGIGKSTNFPKWIEDIRFIKPSPKEEEKLCRVYSQSRVVIGVHGSNMLLPSAHAGSVVNLLPDIKSDQIASDVIFRQEIKDPRVISFTYRFVPITIPIITLARTIFVTANSRNEILKRFES